MTALPYLKQRTNQQQPVQTTIPIPISSTPPLGRLPAGFSIRLPGQVQTPRSSQMQGNDSPSSSQNLLSTDDQEAPIIPSGPSPIPSYPELPTNLVPSSPPLIRRNGSLKRSGSISASASYSSGLNMRLANSGNASAAASSSGLNSNSGSHKDSGIGLANYVGASNSSLSVRSFLVTPSPVTTIADACKCCVELTVRIRLLLLLSHKDRS
ncbi:unnamed protein product [Ambrosiozyma monospora]|uniref:Unnamed protein product n=1 Tax=Ambrosiozyma monospora TaxID=43982 RepID=A0ACB5U0V1_AMBMO|nr:unnamed protein product [Ambrosiozyma monospora]